MIDYKLTLYGSFNAGKTCLITRLLRNTFNPVMATIGASFNCWSPINGEKKIGIWDTAGQERFHSLVPLYLRSSDAVVYCHSLDTHWNHHVVHAQYMLAKEQSPDALFYLALTKSDLAKRIDYDIELFCQTHTVHGVFYTSSLDGTGIQEMFDQIYSDLLIRTKLISNTSSTSTQQLNIQTPQSNPGCFSWIKKYWGWGPKPRE